MSSEFYVVLANIVAALHVGYVSFVTLGLLLILIGIIFRWRWVRNPVFRIAHLVAMAIVTIETVIGMTCPLTTWEDALRTWAGQETSLEGDFIGRVLNDLIFIEMPEWGYLVMYYGAAVVILLTFILAPPRWKNRNIADTR